MAKEAGATVKRVHPNKLRLMTGTESHQGVAAFASEIEYVTVEDLLNVAREKGEPPFLVLSDGIEDPHNPVSYTHLKMSYAKFDSTYVNDYVKNQTPFETAMQDVKANFGLTLPTDPDAANAGRLLLTCLLYTSAGRAGRQVCCHGIHRLCRQPARCDV